MGVVLAEVVGAVGVVAGYAELVAGLAGESVGLGIDSVALPTCVTELVSTPLTTLSTEYEGRISR